MVIPRLSHVIHKSAAKCSPACAKLNSEGLLVESLPALYEGQSVASQSNQRILQPTMSGAMSYLSTAQQLDVIG